MGEVSTSMSSETRAAEELKPTFAPGTPDLGRLLWSGGDAHTRAGCSGREMDTWNPPKKR